MRERERNKKIYKQNFEIFALFLWKALKRSSRITIMRIKIVRRRKLKWRTTIKKGDANYSLNFTKEIDWNKLHNNFVNKRKRSKKTLATKKSVKRELLHCT